MVLENFLADADILWDRAGKKLFEKPEARTGRIMRVQVTNRGVVEDLTGYTLNLGWTSTKDETKIGLDAFEAADITKGIFELEYTSGMLTNIGTLKATLQLVPVAGNTVESDNFVITVTKSAVDAAAVQSETSFTALASALVSVNDWNARIDAVEADFIQRANDMEETYPQELLSLGSQLAETATKAELSAIATPKAVSLGSQMTDITKIYVYTGAEGGYISGNWYYHNGSAWASGGVYQSSGIGEGSITNRHLRLPVPSLLPSNIPFLLGTLGTSNGLVIASTTRVVSDFILFSAGDSIDIVDKANTAYNIAYYDTATQSFLNLGGYTSEKTTFSKDVCIKIIQKYNTSATITDASFFKYNLFVINKDTAVSRATVTAIVDSKVYAKADADDVINKTDKNIIKPEMTTFAKRGKNKFDGIYTSGVTVKAFPTRYDSITHPTSYSVVFEADKLKTYTISKSLDTDRFAVYTYVGKPIHNQAVAREINVDNAVTSVTLTMIGEENYIQVLVTSAAASKTPEWLQIEEGSIVTPFSAYNTVTLNTEPKQTTYYVSTTGADINNGSAGSPLASIQKAIDSGAKRIVVAPGDYINQTIVASNIEEIEILSSGTSANSKTNERKTARLYNAKDIPSLVLDGATGLYKASLTLSVESNWQKVFIDKTLPIESDGYVTNPAMVSYNAILWESKNATLINSDEIIDDKKLVPVLTLSACQTTAGTFYYDGANVYINPSGGTIEGKVYRRLLIEDGELAYFYNIRKLILSDIDFMYGARQGCKIELTDVIEAGHCTSAYSAHSTGFHIIKSNGVFKRCYAFKNSVDGFAPAGNGDTHFYDCYGFYNGDDGISHHDKCTGSITGGEYFGNPKGGVAPAHGSKVDVYNVISHDNGIGFYCVAGSDTLVGRKVNHVANVAYNNDVGIKIMNYHVTAFACKYTNNISQTSITPNADSSLTIL